MCMIINISLASNISAKYAYRTCTLIDRPTTENSYCSWDGLVFFFYTHQLWRRATKSEKVMNIWTTSIIPKWTTVWNSPVSLRRSLTQFYMCPVCFFVCFAVDIVVCMSFVMRHIAIELLLIATTTKQKCKNVIVCGEFPSIPLHKRQLNIKHWTWIPNKWKLS